MRILIMGLPESGKTTLAKSLKNSILNSIWYNADLIRQIHGDWDFSDYGRKRQAERMKNLSDIAEAHNFHSICDFVCPTEKLREIFDAHYTIWMNTIEKSRYEDTNAIFEKPSKYNYMITKFDDKHIENIMKDLNEDGCLHNM